MKISELVQTLRSAVVKVPTPDNPVHKGLMVAFGEGLTYDVAEAVGPDTRKGIEAVAKATSEYLEHVAASLKKIATGIDANGGGDSDMFQTWHHHLRLTSRSLEQAMKNLGLMAKIKAGG